MRRLGSARRIHGTQKSVAPCLALERQQPEPHGLDHQIGGRIGNDRQRPGFSDSARCSGRTTTMTRLAPARISPSMHLLSRGRGSSGRTSAALGPPARRPKPPLG